MTTDHWTAWDVFKFELVVDYLNTFPISQQTISQVPDPLPGEVRRGACLTNYGEWISYYKQASTWSRSLVMSCLTSAQRGAIQCWTPADLEPYREYPALDLHLNLFATAQLYQLSPNSNCPDIPQSPWMNAKSLLKRILHQKTFYRPDLIFWIVMVKGS